MKKLTIIIAALTLSLAASAHNFEHQLSVSGAPFTTTSMFLKFWANPLFEKVPAIHGMLRLENQQNYGTYGINYHYEIVDWFQLGAKASWDFNGFDLYATPSDPTVIAALGGNHELLGRSQSHVITAMLSMQFTYVNNDLVKLYSGIDLGAGYARWTLSEIYDKPIPELNDDLKMIKQIRDACPNGSSNKFMPAFNITALGINVGTFVYGMAELNIGMEAPVKIGFGVRF